MKISNFNDVYSLYCSFMGFNVVFHFASVVRGFVGFFPDKNG